MAGDEDEPYPKKRRYTKRGKLWHEGRSYNYNSSSNSSSHYRCTVGGCLGRANQYHATGEVTVTVEHICGAAVSSQELEQARLKEAAYARLRELTLEAGEGTKAIDIVRKLFEELSPERRAALPSKDTLLQRVRSWAKRDGVQLVKATFEDVLGVEEVHGDADGHPEPSSSSPSLGDSHIVKKEPISDHHDDDPCGEIEMEANPRGKKTRTRVTFLKEKCSRGKPKVRIDDQVYVWTNDLKGGSSSYKCQEAKIGCRVTAKIFRAGEGNPKPYFEVRGTHVHKRRTIPPRPKGTRGRGSEPHLKLVDEEGRDLGAVPLDHILTAGEDATRFSLDYDKLPRVSSAPEDSNKLEGPIGDDDSNDLGDGDINDGEVDAENDYVMDFDEGEPDLGEHADADLDNGSHGRTNNKSVRTYFSAPVTNVEGNRKQRKNSKENKSGEKCFVCGDDLLLSEKISSNKETFRKACCYLNVKTDSNWFPQVSNGKMSYFCESCTKEITRIQQLYQRVEEIQSLIFKRVEYVEKRIADAVIVDNLVEEGPPIQLEGFRKQVLMNYRNKLKLRREIRVGRKMGNRFTEVHPHTSANMFASDPTDTDAFRRTTSKGGQRPAFVSSSSVPLKKNRNPSPTDPQSTSLEQNPDSVRQDICENDDGDFLGLEFDEGDAISVSSEREAKFWVGNPSQLQIDNYDQCPTTNVDEDDNYDENIAGGEQNTDQSTDESDPDFDGNQDESDEDWEMSGTRRRKGLRSTAKRRGRLSKKPITPKASPTASTPQSISDHHTKSGTTTSAPERPNWKQKRKSGSGNIEFPDVVLRKDGRMFMGGIEIIKNAPGAYKRLPKSISFSCGICHKMIQRFWSIKNHICGHHLGMFKCASCEKQFTDLRTLDAHMEFKHSGKDLAPIPCPICEKPIPLGRSLDGVANMKNHRWTHLSEEEKKDPKHKKLCPPQYRDPNRVKRTDGLPTYMCSYCSKTFRQTLALRNHELSHTRDAPNYQCQYCGKMYNSKKNLGGHTQRCSKKHLGTTDTLDRYSCPKCPVWFNNRGVRNKHVRRFHKNVTDPSLPFSCPKCPRCFSSRDGFRSHKRVCAGEGQTILTGSSNKPNTATSAQQPSFTTPSSLETGNHGEFQDVVDHQHQSMSENSAGNNVDDYSGTFGNY